MAIWRMKTGQKLWPAASSAFRLCSSDLSLCFVPMLTTWCSSCRCKRSYAFTASPTPLSTFPPSALSAKYSHCCECNSWRLASASSSWASKIYSYHPRPSWNWMKSLACSRLGRLLPMRGSWELLCSSRCAIVIYLRRSRARFDSCCRGAIARRRPQSRPSCSRLSSSIVPLTALTFTFARQGLTWQNGSFAEVAWPVIWSTFLIVYLCWRLSFATGMHWSRCFRDRPLCLACASPSCAEFTQWTEAAGASQIFIVVAYCTYYSHQSCSCPSLPHWGSLASWRSPAASQAGLWAACWRAFQTLVHQASHRGLHPALGRALDSPLIDFLGWRIRHQKGTRRSSASPTPTSQRTPVRYSFDCWRQSRVSSVGCWQICCTGRRSARQTCPFLVRWLRSIEGLLS